MSREAKMRQQRYPSQLKEIDLTHDGQTDTSQSFEALESQLQKFDDHDSLNSSELMCPYNFKIRNTARRTGGNLNHLKISNTSMEIKDKSNRQSSIKRDEFFS